MCTSLSVVIKAKMEMTLNTHGHTEESSWCEMEVNGDSGKVRQDKKKQKNGILYPKKHKIHK
jgi:hypothetical protein